MAIGSAVLKYVGDLLGSGTLADRKIAESGISSRPICKLPSSLRDLESFYYVQILMKPLEMPLPPFMQSHMVIDENWCERCACREVDDLKVFCRFMKMLRGGNAHGGERTESSAIG
jgi:hypothetical protein